MSLKHIAPSKTAFPSTHWSLLERAGDETQAQAALEEFLKRYMPALKAHLTHRRGLSPEDAEDVVHNFALDKIIQGKLLSRADRSRGRFRTFLLNVIDNYVFDWKRHKGRKSCPWDNSVTEVDPGKIPDSSAQPPDRAFAIEWARQLLTDVFARVEAECRSNCKLQVWNVFVARDVEPMLNGGEPATYEMIVAAGHVQSPTEAYKAIQAGRRMFARLLREVIREYASDEMDVEQELHELMQILSS